MSMIKIKKNNRVMDIDESEFNKMQQQGYRKIDEKGNFIDVPKDDIKKISELENIVKSRDKEIAELKEKLKLFEANDAKNEAKKEAK